LSFTEFKVKKYARRDLGAMQKCFVSLSRRVFLLFLIVGIVAISGCGLFEGRDVVGPDNQSNAFWVPPLSPGNVIHNFKEVLRVVDRTNYSALFTDTLWSAPFEFVADRQFQAYEDMLGWDSEREIFYWDRLADHVLNSAGGGISLVLQSADTTLYGDSASYYADYLLTIDSFKDFESVSYSGIMEFTLIRHHESGDWAISRWEDLASDTTDSWTNLKWEFYWQ
jgi:hypothetical protein